MRLLRIALSSGLLWVHVRDICSILDRSCSRLRVLYRIEAAGYRWGEIYKVKPRQHRYGRVIVLSRQV